MPDDLEQLQREVRELRATVQALQADVKRIRRALGTLCIVVEGSEHKKRGKLESVRMNTLDTFYMPAAFCFDLSRKMDYIYLAMREFVEDANTDIAKRVLNDNGKAYKDNLTWEESAQETERVFLNVLREIHDEHERLLARLGK